jgi:hypothetical protein
MTTKPFKGQLVRSGEQVGRVIRMFGSSTVQVVTKRTRLILRGFPAKPVGEQIVPSRETWKLANIDTL